MQTITVHRTARLDAVILEKYPHLQGGRLHKYLRQNKIKVNGKKTPLSQKLSVGDTVFLYLPDDALFPTNINKDEYFLCAKNILEIVYEDEFVMLVNKPAGICVIDENNKNTDSLINRVLRYLYESGSFNKASAFTPCLCHRLDTGTSGVVIIAKTQMAEEVILNLIQNHSLTKNYLCLVNGLPNPSKATLEAFLIKNPQKGIVNITPSNTQNSKKIITQYKTIKKSKSFALLEITLVTGRTHQIRAHMAYINHPVLGDSKYGINQLNRAYKMKYQALCAYKLTFPPEIASPCSALQGKTFTVPMPWYAQQMMSDTFEQQ